VTALTEIPGMPSGALLGHARALREDPLATLLAAKQHGDLVKLRMGWKPLVVVSSPALAQEILVDRAEDYRKSRALRVYGEPILGTGLVVSEPPLHRTRRALIAPTFAPKRIAGFADAIVAHTEQALARWLAQDALEGCEPSIDLAGEMSRLTLHIVADTLFHAKVEGDVARVGRALEAGTEAIVQLARSAVPLPSFVPTRAGRVVRQVAEELDRIVLRIIRERRASGDDPGDVLSRLLAARDPDSGEGLSDSELRDEVMTLFLAGHETTALALTWSLALLAHHPSEARKLQEELDRTLGQRPPKLADLEHLHYTLAVLKEAMRLYPPAYVITRNSRVETTIGGVAMPRDQLVFINVYGIHRREAAFAQADSFRPERFLSEGEKLWPRCTYLPFGAGPRVCVGNHFALMEGQLALACIAQRLQLTGQVSCMAQPQAKVTLRPRQSMMLRISARAPS
jgi:cytochrome P450